MPAAHALFSDGFGVAVVGGRGHLPVLYLADLGVQLLLQQRFHERVAFGRSYSLGTVWQVVHIGIGTVGNLAPDSSRKDAAPVDSARGLQFATFLTLGEGNLEPGTGDHGQIFTPGGVVWAGGLLSIDRRP